MRLFAWSTTVGETTRAVRLGLLIVGLTCVLSPALHAQSVTFTGSGAVNFGSANVCPAGATTPSPCSQTQTLSYKVSAGTTIGSVNILTLGAPNLDFRAEAGDTSATLCKAQTYGSAFTCNVNVTFAPLAPGPRRGAVDILDGSGNVLATTNIYGSGTGPAVAFNPSPQVHLGSGFLQPWGVAVDGSGNVFVADYGNNTVKEILAAGGYATVKTLGSGFSRPIGAAVDGSGNVFVCDSGNSRVKEILAPDYRVVNTLKPYFLEPWALTIDASGNVFVLEEGGPDVKEILASDGYKKTLTLGGGFDFSDGGTGSGLYGVAVDPSGNLFVSSHSSQSMYELPAAGGYTTVNTVPAVINALPNPTGVAVDASGNLYVSDLTSGSADAVYEFLAADGYATVNNLGFFEEPIAFALDAVGDIFVSDITTTQIGEIQRSQPTPLSFPPSLQSMTVQNIGNVPLDAEGVGLAVSPNWELVAGSGTPPDCTSTFTLAPSAECNLSISFEPSTSGPLSGTVQLTDNALNAAPPNYATQTIALASNPPVASISAAKLDFGTIAYGSTATLPLTITNIGGGTLTIKPSITGFSYIFGTGGNCGSTIAAGGSCTFQVEFDPQRVGDHNGETLAILINGNTTFTVKLHGIASGVGAVTPLDAVFFNVAVGSYSTFNVNVEDVGVTGPVTLAVVNEGPSTASYRIGKEHNTCASGLTAGATCTLPVEFAPRSLGSHYAHIVVTPSNGSPAFIIKAYGVGVAP